MAANVVDTARAYLGQQYVWGGESKEEGGFDCSGLVYAALKEAGYDVGRNTAAGYAKSLGEPVDLNNLQPGDLVFWANTGSRTGVTHMGIYAGNGHIIDASSSKNAVVYRKMWGTPVAARRVTGMPPAQSAGELTQLAGLSEREQRDLRRLGELGIKSPADLGVIGNAATGQQTVAGGETKLPPNASPVEVEAYVRENYPGAAYLLSIPETRQIVINGAQQGLSHDRLKGEIEKTDWYRKNSESQRQWSELVATDEATANQRRATQRAFIQDQASRAGWEATDAQLDFITEASLAGAWGQQQITDTIAQNISFKKPAGDARTILQNLRSQAADFAVPVDRATLEFWTRKIVAGEQDEDDFTGFLRGQAVGLFKGNEAAVRQIESGFNVRQIAAAALGFAGRELDIADTSTIDLLDPKWLRLVHHYDDQTKTFRPMDASEVVSTVRKNKAYGFDRSMRGREAAAGLMSEIRRRAGLDG